jgi:hypothetical protein
VTNITVTDLFRILSYGEFSNLAIGSEGSGTVTAAAQPRIVQHANEGLLRLYSKYILSEKDVIVELVEGITHYHLDSRFSETVYNPAEVEYPYIKDMGRETFANDVIRVLAVYDSLGNRLPLNDNELSNSVFTPQARVLQVPYFIEEVSLSILYQAQPPILSHLVPTAEVELPDVLVGALTAFVAWKVYSFMNTAEATGKAQEHKFRYEEICAEAVSEDLVATSISTTNNRFAKRGWI